MKQSKKLLSIFLAMLMLLGTVSVVGNAALAKDQIAYDSIDNAKLTPEQVAGIILDMLDNDVMPGLGVIEIPVLGNLDLSSIDRALSSVHSLLGNGTLGFLAGGDAQTLIDNRDQLKYNGHVVQRSDGNLQVVYQLLQFLGNDAVSSVLAKAPGGLLVDGGITIGGLTSLVSGLVDLSSINAILTNIPGFLATMVFDMLIYGSYGYDKDSEELEGKLPAEADTLDEIVNVAVTGLLTKPQKYEWVPVTDANGDKTYDAEGNVITKKVWDMDSKILNLTAQEIADLDLNIANNSIFSILDKALPIAYETFGTVVLNHDVKKIFMEAMGVDFVRITDAKEIADITKAGTGYINVNGEGSDSTSAADKAKVKNYFCNAQMWQVDGTWYFRDYVTTEIGTDDEGNPITEKRDRFFKAQTYNVDELYSIFNWDYELTASDLDFAQMTKKVEDGGDYGSLAGSLNHILYVILKKAINPTAIGLSSIDEIWVDGANTNFNSNLMKTAKFLLTNYTFMFFGRNEAYVDLDTLEAKPEFIQKVNSFGNDAAGREGLIAYMLLPLLGDVLPQLVYSADMFEPGLQIEQVAALLVREFLTDLTPQVNDYVCNYDAQIFADPTLKTGRSLVKGKDSAYWMNLVLNMGLDLAAIYLDNIANFGVDLKALKDLHTIANGTTIQPWQVVLEEIVDWAVLYIGSGKNSVIKGLDPTTLGVERCVTYNYKDDSYSIDKTKFVGGSGKGSAFFTLSTALNTLLPLGIVNGGSSPEGSANNFGLDVEVIFNKLKDDIIPTLNIEGIIGFFGRNNHPTNFLNNKNIPNQIVTIVNKLLGAIFGRTILNAGDANNKTPLGTMLEKGNLGSTIKNIVMGLNERKVGILEGALPVLALFVSDWGGEQEIGSPSIYLDNAIVGADGTLNHTLTIRNGSKGIWRSYMNGSTRMQDEQYTYNVTSIVSLDSRVVVGAGGTGALAFGAAKTFTLTGTIPSDGVSTRIDITYSATNEDGQPMADGKQFTESYFVFVGHDNNIDYNRESNDSWTGNAVWGEMPKIIYVADNDIASLAEQEFFRTGSDRDNITGKKTVSLKPSGKVTQNGITLKSVSLKDVSKENEPSSKVFEVNTGAFEGVGHEEAKYTFTYAIDADGSGNYSTDVYVYNSEDRALLENLVNDEANAARQMSDYRDAGAEAYNNYLSVLAESMKYAYNPQTNTKFPLNAYAQYEKLVAAVEALKAYEKTDAEKATAGGSIDGAVDNLKTQLDGIQKNFDGKDYRTYMLYRWEKYKAARSDANWIINLKEEVKFGAPTKHFPYGSYSQAQYTNLVAGDKYETFLKALLVDMTEEEKAQAAENYKNRSNEYYGQTTLDVAQYSNLLTRMSQRLILRTSTPVTSYLQKEIDSAKKDIGTTKGNYSELSWAPYAKALSDAEAALSSKSQDVIFAAKYQLQVTRNNLRTVEKEADYTELNRLIDQAEIALQNSASYKNATESPEDFGKLLIALGYTTDGGTKLFGGAKDVENYSYDKHDQDEVDDAADEIKAALAKLEFNDFSSKKPSAIGTTEVETGEQGEDGEAIKEEIYTTKIAAKQVSQDVINKLKGGDSTWKVQVSLDEKYTSKTDADLEKLPVGTGATVTIAVDKGGVMIPVATIKVIVEGDVTGDGVIDAMDCMVVDLVANNNSSLGGVYLVAGDSDGNGAIKIEDLNPVITKALA